MIKANELRINNFVEKDGTWFFVDHVTILMAHNYNPIPLTAKILESSGFKKGEYEGREQWLGPVLIRYQRTTEYRVGIMKSESYNFYTYEDAVCLVRIDSLHQLQNLYFALTGEELEYKQEMAVNENGRPNKKP